MNHGSFELSLNLARLAIPTFVISCRPIAFSRNPITHYNSFAACSKLFPTVTELFQHFLLDPAKQSTTFLSAPSLLCRLNCTVTPCSLKAHFFPTFPRQSISPERNPAICTCCHDQQQDCHRGNVNSKKTLRLCGFLFSGKSIKQQMTLKIHCNKPSTTELPLIYHNDDSNWIGRLIAFSQAVKILQ